MRDFARVAIAEISLEAQETFFFGRSFFKNNVTDSF